MWSDVPTIAGIPEFVHSDALYIFRDGDRPCSESEFRQGDTSRAATTMCDVLADVSDEQIDALGIAGPESYARDWLGRYREAGVDIPVLSPAGVFSLPPFDLDAWATYRRLGELCNSLD